MHFRTYFHGEPPPPEYTPAEECMLDVTAWVVAISICWTPQHDSWEDYADWSEVSDDISSEKKKDSKGERADDSQGKH